MSKIRLRALNSQNISTLPSFSDLNKKSLFITWKLFFVLFITTVNQNNYKIFFKIKKQNKNIIKSKQYFLWNKFTKKTQGILKYKKQITNVKITQTNNLTKIFILKINNIYAQQTNKRFSLKNKQYLKYFKC